MANGSVLSGVRPQQQPDLAGALLGGISGRQSVLAGQQQLQRGQMDIERAPQIAAQQDAAAAQQQQLGQQQISENDFMMAVQRGRIINRLAKQVRQMPAGQRPQFVQALDPEMLQSVGIDPAQIQDVGLDDQSLDAIIAQTDAALSSVDGGLTAGQRDRQSLLQDLEGGIDPATGQLKPENQLTARQRAAAIDLGLMARSGTITGQERIAQSPEATQMVAGSREAIRRAESRGGRIGTGEGAGEVADIEARAAAGIARAEGQARQSVAMSSELFENTQAARSSLTAINDAIEAIDQGAQSGPIINRLAPTVRNSTIQLQNAGRRLGLDVISSVTFGALSEAEMNLAMETAMPNLPPQELRQWLVNRREAQQKLSEELEDAALFMSRGGTLDEFIERGRERRQGSGQNGAGSQNTVNWGDLP